MGKLIVTEFMTLDGVAQAPGGRDEDRESGFAHGGWQAPFVDAAAGDEIFEEASRMGALLLGRRTYEIFAAYWPQAPQEMPFTGLLNRVPKYVASRTLSDPLSWNASSLLAGDFASSIAELKDRHDEVHVIGSLDLVQSLLEGGHIDRLSLWQYPLVLGVGKRVFAHGTVPMALRLTASVTHANGALHLTYEPAGAPALGDLAARKDDQ